MYRGAGIQEVLHMSEQARLTQEQVLENLKRAGITIPSTLSPSFAILDQFAKTGSVPEIDRNVFLFGLYMVWKKKTPNKKTRTVLGLSRTMEKRFNIASGYHRLTGRLNKSREIYRTFLSLFLLEWEEVDGNVTPHSLFPTQERVDELLTALFRREDACAAMEKRLRKDGINSEDLQYLAQAQLVLGQPIALEEIVPILLSRC